MAFRVFLKNGEEVRINDHVYCSPSWDTRDGTPYSIARIMQFLPPEDAPKGEEGKNYLYTRVRLAWYYRPSDVSDRPVSDPRLLLAAIYSEVCDINQLRARCHVVHRDRISDLSGWKKRPDRFYFNRLFDPYIKKEFEVIPSQDVRNLPDNIRDVLVSRYEYVVAEKEVIPDLTDSIRLCDACNEWCPTSDSVSCDRCKKWFHMRCVQPPLAAKPSRGYGWTCAPCSLRHEEEVDSHDVRPNTGNGRVKSNAPAARGRGRPRKDRHLADVEENLPVRHFNMWPFRYFGQHTLAEDTLDSEDLIFPRTASRLGLKYQVHVSPYDSNPYRNPPRDEERGLENNATVEILSSLSTLTDAERAEADEIMNRLSNDPEQRCSVDWLTEVVGRLSDAALDGSMQYVKILPTRLEKWKGKEENPYTDKEWNRDEIVAFEDAIMQHGAELRLVRDEVGTRSIHEVVRFYGHWKNMKLGEANKRRKQSGPSPKSTRLQYRTLAELLQDGQRVGHSDDESSVIAQPSKTPSCGACRNRESNVWWKAPKGLPTNILCATCGTNWRKYADLNVRPVREEMLSSSKMRDKREGTPLSGQSAKRPRTSASAHSTPPPTISIAPQNRCLACMKSGPIGKVVKCKVCGLRVHAGTGGVRVDPFSSDSWVCDLCENDESLEASMNPDCLLCPRATNEEKKRKPYPPADTFLRACKPTEGQGWAHVLCAVFTQELTFTDASRLRLVEGLNAVARHKWTARCSLCGERDGAVIRCSDCPREFHSSCAWKHGDKFGFEIQPVKSSRRDTTTTTTFKGETGCMNPIVSCRDHDRSKREIYDICETNDGGQTALQVYCQAYKQAAISQAHALLRKARRLDTILHIKTDGVHIMPLTTLPEPECFRCHSQFSPFFYRITESIFGLNGHASDDGDTKDVWVCHKCDYEATRGNGPVGKGHRFGQGGIS